jgi:hypothetical protein
VYIAPLGIVTGGAELREKSSNERKPKEMKGGKRIPYFSA